MLINPELRNVALSYFSKNQLITVVKQENGFYRYTSDGRHRIMAAQELDIFIPYKYSKYLFSTAGKLYGSSLIMSYCIDLSTTLTNLSIQKNDFYVHNAIFLFFMNIFNTKNKQCDII